MKDAPSYIPPEVQVEKDIVVPHDKVIFLDKDLTLLDPQYKITDPLIFKSIDTVQNAGWVIGLNSDTSLESLQQLSSMLGIRGPIIAERGAVIFENNNTVYDTKDFDDFSSSRIQMVEVLRENGLSVEIVEGREIAARVAQSGLKNSNKAFLNNSRRMGIGIHFRSYDREGNSFIDQDFNEFCATLLNPTFPPFDDLVVDLNPTYGILILSRSSMSKRRGAQKYMKNYGYTQIGMIGNAMPDYVGNDIALHYAVGNSTEEFKKAADYVAKGEITSGVVEILEKLVESN